MCEERSWTGALAHVEAEIAQQVAAQARLAWWCAQLEAAGAPPPPSLTELACALLASAGAGEEREVAVAWLVKRGDEVAQVLLSHDAPEASPRDGALRQLQRAARAQLTQRAA